MATWGWIVIALFLLSTAWIATHLLRKQDEVAEKKKQETEIAIRQATEAAILDATSKWEKSVTGIAARPVVVPKTEHFPAVTTDKRPPAQLVGLEQNQDTMPSNIKIQSEQLSIGRERTFSDVVIPNRYISRIHARIHYRDDEYQIIDEGSTSGTFVNDEKLTDSGHVLKKGDIIRMGPAHYRFELI